jgi:hypothetical protein
MVRVLKHSSVRVAIYLGILCAAAWVLIPEIVVDRSDPYLGLVWKALAANRQQNDGYPRSFLDIEPHIELMTRTDCRITETSPGNYRIDMPLVNGKTYYMDVVYALTPDGDLEKCDVRYAAD